MTKYHADIGTWAKGITVDIEVLSPEDAFDMLAREHGADNIVQIWEAGTTRFVYDYCNWFKLYKL